VNPLFAAAAEIEDTRDLDRLRTLLTAAA